MAAPWFKFGAPAVLLLFIAVAAWLAFRPKKTIVTAPTAPATVYFEVRTTPPGATILNGATTLGASNSQLHLAPGQYQLTARKDGYQPVTIPVNLQTASPPPFNVTLNPIPASLHLFTPFKTGNLYLDDKPAEALPQSGEVAISPLEPGKHTLRIESDASKASIAFEVQPLTLPVVNKPEAKGIDAVAVATFRDQAALASSLADLQVQVDNQDSGKLAGGQATLKALSPGSHTLAVGGWTGSLDAGPAPSMNIFLGSLASQGRLNIEVKGADDAHIFVNGADRGTAQKGRYRLSLDPGDYEVKVARDGFLPTNAQRASVHKGGGSRLIFVLVPKYVAPVPAVTTTELPSPPKLQGIVMAEGLPANGEVRYARSGGTSYQSFRLPSMELDAGSYVFIASAPGHLDDRRTVEVAAGGSYPIKFNLPTVKAAVVAPTPIVHSMSAEEWDKTWTFEEPWYTRQGGDFILYKVTPTAGTFDFVISPNTKGGIFGGAPKVRWVIDYLDPKNYIEFEIDKQSFASAEYRNGKKTDHSKRRPHGVVNATSFRIKMVVEASRVSVQINSVGDKYEPLDQWSEIGHNFADGHFGFRLPNQDQMFLTEFKFTQPAGNR